MVFQLGKASGARGLSNKINKMVTLDLLNCGPLQITQCLFLISLELCSPHIS